MNIYFLILFICLFWVEGCNNSKKENKQIGIQDNSICNSVASYTLSQKSPFYSFWGIDSIVDINYMFSDSIDSISIGKLIGEAMYLSAHKGGVIIERYNCLFSSHPSEYESITKVHTAHLLLIGDKIFSFNGKGEVKSPKEIPESTEVVIKASVYSFYSKGICLGRHVFLDSIKIRSESVKSNKPLRKEKDSSKGDNKR